ncbi:hypothetical protein ABE099_16800 [Paenibacillus turicensis]|uniref:hypothetical protein n=1 Tax=Paenibacillus turicensis TaxID=160487 RepID=UPI003D2D2990
MELKKLNIEEGSIEFIGINSKTLIIELKKWNQRTINIIINDYTKLIDFNSIGREISELLVLENSELLRKEKEELMELDFDIEELSQLIHLQFIGLSNLPLLEVVFNKNEVEIKEN